MDSESELWAQALALPQAERAELASQLLLSLELEENLPDQDAEWVAEIERRRLAFDQGETSASPWREAIRRIEQDIHPGANQ